MNERIAWVCLHGGKWVLLLSTSSLPVDLCLPADAMTRAGQKLCMVVYPQMDGGGTETNLSKETKEQLKPMCETEDFNESPQN